MNNTQATTTTTSHQQLHIMLNKPGIFSAGGNTTQGGLLGGGSEGVAAVVGAVGRRGCIAKGHRCRAARRELRVTWSVTKKLRRKIYDTENVDQFIDDRDVTERRPPTDDVTVSGGSVGRALTDVVRYNYNYVVIAGCEILNRHQFGTFLHN